MISVKTNNLTRDLVTGAQVPEKVLQNQFSTLTADQIQGPFFFRYDSKWHNVHTFQMLEHDAAFDDFWHGVRHTSDGGYVAHVEDDYTAVVVGRF